MALKNKDKVKLADWMQCSLCMKFISSQDAEAHSKSCDSGHSYIQGKAFHGKVKRAEGYVDEDGSSITESISDKDSVVWVAIPTMQVCGLSIGQPCIINRIIVKRSWPLKSLPLSNVALSAQCMVELGTKEDDMVVVERFVPNYNVVKSAVLQLRKPSDVFEKAEFLSFAASYLDGKYITEGTPLSVKYFGQVCHCYVSNMVCELPLPPQCERTAQEQVSSPSKPVQALVDQELKTPTEQTHQRHKVMATNSLSQGKASLSANGDASLYTPCQDMSDSVADLNMSSLAIASAASTPKISERDTFPNLVTPIKNSVESAVCCGWPSEYFARVSSKLTIFSVLPTQETGRNIQNKANFTLADIGGMKSQIEELKRRISRALQTKCRNRGILLFGPAGTGKSLLIKALTLELGMNTVYVDGTDIRTKFFGGTESNLSKIFKSARDKAPSIIVIDNIDIVCPERSQNQAGQQGHSIVGTLRSLLEENAKAQTPPHTVVIGITNNIDNINPALRRFGRFGWEVDVGVPTAAERREILDIFLSKVPNDLKAEDVETVARNAHGYVGADLRELVNKACFHSSSCLAASAPSNLSVNLTLKDLAYAGKHVRPSALREIRLEVPEVKWTDIGGMSEVKMKLCEAVEWPLKDPEAFKRLCINPPRGLLMYGPPGCSKTMVARALATECKLNFLSIKGPEIFNQYVGESEKAIREVFRKARSAAPSIIFIDEIDAIATKRGSSGGGSGVEDRVVTQLLAEMDGLEILKDVFVIAATNRPDKIDRALLRPGRFESLVYVPLPDAETRRQILEINFSTMSVAHDVSLESLVDSTHSYSGAEIIQVCQEAANYTLREDINAQKVLGRHFDAALEQVRPQIDQDLLQIYMEFSTTKIK